MKRNKKTNKITMPKDGMVQTKMAAFRCDDELSKLLDRLDDKSVFIREAILEAFENRDLLVKCPHCKGHGKVIKTRLKKVS